MSQPMMKRLAVALLIETSNSYARGLLRGIGSYIHEHGRWIISLPEQRRGEVLPDWLENWSGDGIIARVENHSIAKVVRKARLPVVDVSAGRFLPDVPCVETHNENIARLGVEHFVERGFRNLAFCGDPAFHWANERQDFFQKKARELGLGCQVFVSTSGSEEHSLIRQQQEMREWVLGLPKPIGVMACYDIKAQQLLEVCRSVGTAVPEEVAVLGVDDDELLCSITTPPLSSVILNTHQTGYEAAHLLDRMLAGEEVEAVVHLINPLGIHTRQSTDVLAIEDRDVATSVRFIREHACDGINVEDVLGTVLLSRRVLERLFKKYLGHTPHEEIVRVKVERVKRLLSETDLGVGEVARRTGFRHVEYLSATFKKITGIAPITYRRQSRGK